MAKSTPPGQAAQAAATGFNSTDSGPANDPAGGKKEGEGVAKAAAVGKMAAAMPHNPNKQAEHGRDKALTPPEGASVQPPSRDATGSTLAEKNHTEKYGKPAAPGVNAAGGSLERVRADPEGQPLTTNQGVRVSDNQNSLKAGLRGAALLKDFVLREKITHFDHERIPERVVHARGSGAHGYFECYEPLSSLTQASLFAEAGKITPVFVRFSTVAGERGSKDTARDVRGFAVKFYTDEGNWDLVGNNMPVFFIQDAMKFPDLVHAVKPEPHHAMPQAASAHDTYWDFVSLMPESTHMLMWQMSDRAIPRSFRMMQGFGVHTFRFVNAQGESTFVKFHWNPKLGTHSLVWDEAVKISGADPDYNRRDLWEAIESGAYPEWELCVQAFTEEQAEAFSFDVLDATKIVPEELVPLQPVGRMVLNRNPDNFFAETEQVAFCAAHVVPGIDFTNDPLLAGRIHSYVDTQITRLGGPNFHELPINAPLAPVQNNQRDGMHRQAIHRGRSSYEPNSLGGGCPHQAGTQGFVSFPEPIHADEVRGKPEKFAEHYNQAALFYNSQTEAEQRHIAAAFRFELSKVTVPAVRRRVVSMLRNASEELAAEVAQGLGMELPEAMPRALAKTPKPEVEVSPALSLTARQGDAGIQSRQVAVLVADGVDGAAVWDATHALQEQGAVVRLVGPHIGAVTPREGPAIDADASLENHPGVLFDGVIVPGGPDAAKRLAADPKAREFLTDQFLHSKTIWASRDAEALLRQAGITAQDEELPGIFVTAKGGSKALQNFVSALGHHRHFERERPAA
ncbi:catalase [Pusillimonas noertemannii]|uniref:Catalase n=1 Tax=Pusillimonas noertemannii TaxID=305977 RepID=A0A2U1CJD2_9BURK|nr:catalase [Pusillimonas noertemannii]NYT69956.1 catalase [Pusillimonas noertemannii]PVY61119.1 catalase [Pusillimonas noertemannii]TFL09249.1 catalase [Pusillimonas noertemannii]